MKIYIFSADTIFPDWSGYRSQVVHDHTFLYTSPPRKSKRAALADARVFVAAYRKNPQEAWDKYMKELRERQI